MIAAGTSITTSVSLTLARLLSITRTMLSSPLLTVTVLLVAFQVTSPPIDSIIFLTGTRVLPSRSTGATSKLITSSSIRTFTGSAAAATPENAARIKTMHKKIRKALFNLFSPHLNIFGFFLPRQIYYICTCKIPSIFLFFVYFSFFSQLSLFAAVMPLSGPAELPAVPPPLTKETAAPQRAIIAATLKTRPRAST